MRLRLTTNPDTSEMGRRMTERMLELRLSDEDVADITKLHKDTIRAYRRLPDPRPTAKNAALVAKALQWPTDRLLHGTIAETFVQGDLPSSSKVNGPIATASLANELRDQLRAVYAELNGVSVDRIDIRIELH